jgi:uncharacterized protein
MGPICVKNTKKYGRGVFATRDIKKGELIEEAPVIFVPQKERRFLKKTIVSEYYFYWGEHYEDAAIALGFGSFYNHSYTPNATFNENLVNQSIDFYAIDDIKAGDEITINYNGDPDDKSPLWFEED